MLEVPGLLGVRISCEGFGPVGGSGSVDKVSYLLEVLNPLGASAFELRGLHAC